MFQSYAAEAGPERAEQPIETAGMSDEILQKVRTARNGRFASRWVEQRVGLWLPPWMQVVMVNGTAVGFRKLRLCEMLWC